MKKTQRVVRNADNEHLLPKSDGVSTLGYVPEVSGEEGAEVSGFVPTRHELIQLAEYWRGVAVDTRWRYFIAAHVGSSDWRLQEIASDRFVRISKLIDSDAISDAADRAHAKCRQDGRDVQLWDYFMELDADAWSEVTEDTFRELEKDIPA